jgi:hypothetical protein
MKKRIALVIAFLTLSLPAFAEQDIFIGFGLDAFGRMTVYERGEESRDYDVDLAFTVNGGYTPFLIKDRLRVGGGMSFSLFPTKFGRHTFDSDTDFSSTWQLHSIFALYSVVQLCAPFGGWDFVGPNRTREYVDKGWVYIKGNFGYNAPYISHEGKTIQTKGGLYWAAGVGIDVTGGEDYTFVRIEILYSRYSWSSRNAPGFLNEGLRNISFSPVFGFRF